MKFYGIDMQGAFKIQELTSLPTFTPAIHDRQFMIRRIDGTNEELYYGSTEFNKWVKVQIDNGGAPTDTIIQYLIDNYHPVGGGVGTTMTADFFTGTTNGTYSSMDVTNHILVLDSDNNSPTGDAVIYNGTPLNGAAGPQTGDQYIWWNADATNSGRLLGNGNLGAWVINNTLSPGGTGAIATEEWVEQQFPSGAEVYTRIQANQRFLRLNPVVPPTDDIVSYVIGNMETPSFDYEDSFYTSGYIHDHFVRFAYGGEYHPDGLPCYASIGTSGNVVANQYNVVRRDGSCNLYANIGYLTAQYSLYADLAEKYTCPELPVGTVVEVSDDGEYEVVPCAFELSPTAVGVVSDTPALLMNEKSSGMPIALTGKVQVRVVGPIFKGDFIVPAGSGLARKGDVHELVFKMGASLETNEGVEEKLVYCIIK